MQLKVVQTTTSQLIGTGFQTNELIQLNDALHAASKAKSVQREKELIQVAGLSDTEAFVDMRGDKAQSNVTKALHRVASMFKRLGLTQQQRAVFTETWEVGREAAHQVNHMSDVLNRVAIWDTELEEGISIPWATATVSGARGLGKLFGGRDVNLTVSGRLNFKQESYHLTGSVAELGIVQVSRHCKA